MSTLYLDRKDLELRGEGRHLCIYVGEERQGTIPLNLVERVVVHGQVRLTTGVLRLLADEGVGLLALGGRGRRQPAMLLGKPHGDVERRIAQYRWHFDEACRWRWSRRLLQLKLRSQRRALEAALEMRPDCRKPLHDAIGQLARGLESLRHASSETVSLAGLRGMEGAAAAAYFGGFCALFPPSLEFTGRNRRPPRDPVNAALSLSYTLLHFEAVAACHGAGLDPCVGFFHDPAYNRESLAADFIEPLRAHVDTWIWRLFADRRLRAESFARDGDACLLDKTGREVFFAEYERQAGSTRRVLRRAAQRVAVRLASSGKAP